MAAGMTELAGEALCSAHHGLCLAVTAHRDSETRTVLFDAGPDPYALERNGRHMHLDFGRIEALVLSHGHFDHSEGLVKALELIRERMAVSRFRCMCIPEPSSNGACGCPVANSFRSRTCRHNTHSKSRGARVVLRRGGGNLGRAVLSQR